MRKKAKGNFILYSQVLEIIKRSNLWAPRVLYYPIIKELEKFKLIKKIDRRKYEIVGGKADSSLNQFNCPI